MIELNLCDVVFTNGQIRRYAFPEPTLEWGEKVYKDILKSGDVELFCEHPYFLDNGDYGPWGVTEVKLTELKWKVKRFQLLMMTEKTFDSIELIVEAINDKDAERLVNEYVYLTQDLDSTLLSIEEIK